MTRVAGHNCMRHLTAVGASLQRPAPRWGPGKHPGKPFADPEPGPPPERLFGAVGDGGGTCHLQPLSTSDADLALYRTPFSPRRTFRTISNLATTAGNRGLVPARVARRRVRRAWEGTRTRRTGPRGLSAWSVCGSPWVTILSDQRGAGGQADKGAHRGCPWRAGLRQPRTTHATPHDTPLNQAEIACGTATETVLVSCVGHRTFQGKGPGHAVAFASGSASGGRP